MFLQSFRLDSILPYFAALNMSIHIAGDLKSLWLLTGLQGSASTYPCILCHTKRLKRKENGIFNLQNKDEFYKAGNPRLISDFETPGQFGQKQVNNELRRLMNEMKINRLDKIICFAPLHLILSLNSLWRHSTNPKSWIPNFSDRLLNKSLSENEKKVVVSCFRARKLFISMEPLRDGNQPAWFGRDLHKIFKLIPLLRQKLIASNHNDWLVNDLFLLFEHFERLHQSCLKSKTIDGWQTVLADFKQFVIPFCNRQTTLGSLYIHLISVHLEPILDNNHLQGLNSIASDQIMESSHSVVHKFCDQLGLPSTSKDPQPWSIKEECWDTTMKRIVSRYNRACFQNDDFVDLPSSHQSNHELRLSQSEIDNIFATNLTSALKELHSIWKLPNIAHE